MTFINRERIALLESKFHFQIECCYVPTVALFQIRNADWFVIGIRQMFTCKSVVVGHGPKGMVDHYISQSRAVSQPGREINMAAFDGNVSFTS